MSEYLDLHLQGFKMYYEGPIILFIVELVLAFIVIFLLELLFIFCCIGGILLIALVIESFLRNFFSNVCFSGATREDPLKCMFSPTALKGIIRQAERY